MKAEKKMKCYSDYMKTYLPSSNEQTKIPEDHRLLGEEYASRTIAKVREHDMPRGEIKRA